MCHSYWWSQLGTFCSFLQSSRCSGACIYLNACMFFFFSSQVHQLMNIHEFMYTSVYLYKPALTSSSSIFVCSPTPVHAITCTCAHVSPPTQQQHQARPMLRVAVEATSVNDLPKLERGLKRLHRADPAVEVETSGRGEQVCSTVEEELGQTTNHRLAHAHTHAHSKSAHADPITRLRSGAHGCARFKKYFMGTRITFKSYIPIRFHFHPPPPPHTHFHLFPQKGGGGARRAAPRAVPQRFKGTARALPHQGRCLYIQGVGVLV